ncbi:MAG: crossover junction endodeoxyribonuclease RuvC [Opitutales bacterium]|nr:crossover junction endodeoxyribonuclease RuvC [Opitutales bacterium]
MARASVRQMWAQKLAGKASSQGVSLASSLQAQRSYSGRILGIDPSLRGTGLAIVDATGKQFSLVASRVLKNPPKLKNAECLGRIAQGISDALDAYACDAVAVEETIYVQNFRTAQILGAARGAAIAVPAMRGIPLFEYPPLRVKQSVAGFGRASKEQVAKQVQGLLNLANALGFDESDAAAVAICHALTQRSPI